MKSYKLKLTALSPIHIGSGEDYEPTNFVVEDNYLYEFDEYKFFENLSQNLKEKFLEIVSLKGSDSLFKLHKFIKDNKQAAIKASYSKVQISKGMQKDYEVKIGNVVKTEGKRDSTTKVFNKFLIARTQRDKNTNKVYIPGSSIKGSISTAIQESFFNKNKKNYQQSFANKNPSQNILKNLLISDTIPIKVFNLIGYSNNKERFEDDEQGPTNKIETIYSNSSTNSMFELTLSLKELEPKIDFEIKDIIRMCNNHYMPLFESMFDDEESTPAYFSDGFYEKYKNFKLKENQFLLRVGKHSGARAVTIENNREISVKVSGGGKRRKPIVWDKTKEETTIWLFSGDENTTQNLLPFGWIVCEVYK